ncbi:hypothetical protein SLS64_005113 [Diaporthe eres]
MSSILKYSLLLFAVLARVQASPHALLPRASRIVDCGDNEAKVKTALADAAALANIAFDMDTSSTAFTHYLRGEDGAMAKALWSAVASNNDPTNPSYSFSVSLAVTDAAPQDGDALREMKLCPLFFTDARTKNNLDSKKYDGDKRGSWCQKGQKFRDFETAGHTILHEMTHLDALGEDAGMPARTQDDFTSHGTDDVAYPGDYVSAAREFLSDWVDDPDSMDPNALKPYQNAENIAAAATGMTLDHITRAM